jgi:hypothetical protein
MCEACSGVSQCWRILKPLALSVFWERGLWLLRAQMRKLTRLAPWQLLQSWVVIYTDFRFSLPYSALVWGLSVKHNPQKVGKDHTLEDEDVIQIVKK